MVKIQILTRHGNSIGVEVEDLDEARKLLSNRLSGFSVSLFDAVAVPGSYTGLGDQL